MLKGAKEALAVARGETPAASITIKGHTYVPKAIANKWEPIETAPRDGTRFYAAMPDGQGWIVGICLWCKTPHVPLYGFHFTEGDPENWEMTDPTHWMHMPEPPTT